MSGFLIRHRIGVVWIGLVSGGTLLFLNAFVPSDFARDQLPWMLSVIPMFVVSAVLVLRDPESRVGWLLFGIATVGAFGTLQGFEAWNGWLAAIGAGASTFAISLISLLLLVFPDGSLPGGRWRWAAAVVVANAVFGGVLGLLVGFWGGASEQAEVLSPLHESTAGFTEVAINLFFPAFAVGFVLGMGSLVARYRRGTAETRHQLKWLLAAMVLMVVAMVPLLFERDSSQAAVGWQAFLLAAGFASVPVAIGIAVLRYRLYDIDLVISRSLTYGALAGFIGVVYIGFVVGVGAVIGEGASFGLSIAATAGVALAFQPVRRGVQRRANQLVFGERATPYEVLARFSRRAAETPEDELLLRIPRLIVDGTGASHATLWVRSGDRFRVAASWPEVESDRQLPVSDTFHDASADRSLPVHHDGELLGGVSLVTARGEVVTPSESQLLDDLVAGLGLALRNARLTGRLRRQVEDLERSRDRIVTAADEARRSLEHDLDSGPQQQLVALKVKLGPIRKMAERAGAARTAEVLAQLDEAAGDAITAVREFAGGVYPPLLEAEGLAVALGNHARRATVPVRISAETVGRYPREIEAAVYFTVLEAMQNTAKYAAAQQVDVMLEGGEGSLSFSVRDDGRGFDTGAESSGAGLSNMADRIDSVGGALTVESAPGSGTTVHGSVPVSAPVSA